jgi:hypothetical protein
MYSLASSIVAQVLREEQREKVTPELEQKQGSIVEGVKRM